MKASALPGRSSPRDWGIAKPPTFAGPHVYKDQGVRITVSFDARKTLGPNAIHSTACPCRTGQEEK